MCLLTANRLNYCKKKCEQLEKERAEISGEHQELAKLYNKVKTGMECKTREAKALKFTVGKLNDEIEKEQNKAKYEKQARRNHDEAYHETVCLLR